MPEVLALLAEHGQDARPLAGGQSLVPMLNLRLAAPAVVVDLNAVPGLDYIVAADGTLAVGALARQRLLELSPAAAAIGALADGLPLVGHVAIRNRGTVGGSIAHADPAAELPLALVAVGGSVVVEGPAGGREIGADELFAGFLTTTLAPGELAVEVRFPTPRPRDGSALLEVAQRHGDFPLAAVAVSLQLDEDGDIAGARVAAGAVADRPVLLSEAADALAAGAGPDEAGRVAAGEVVPSGTLHAPAGYQRHLVAVLTARAVRRAVARARRSGAMEHSATPPGSEEPRSEEPGSQEPGSQEPGSQEPGSQQYGVGPKSPAGGCTVNGKTASFDGVPDRRLLSDFLRHDLGLRGTHVGCEHGVCGACTIRLDGVAVRSCLLLARQADGAAIGTVEGLAADDGALHPLQDAFGRHYALQCGFCTPGILMAAAELLDGAPGRAAGPPDEDEIRRLLSGHLCRCTGYEPIVAAIADVCGLRLPSRTEAVREDRWP